MPVPPPDPSPATSGNMQASPTDRWLATVADVMPPLVGPAGTAERLLLLVHYGIDWRHGWVTRYRKTYWDGLLPDRIIVATFRSANLGHWWREVAGELQSQPRSTAERIELEKLLRADPVPVLTVLRLETEPLLLRTRIVADAVRTTHHAPPITAASDAAAPPPASLTGAATTAEPRRS